MRRLFFHCCWLAIAWNSPAQLAFAEAHTVTATGEYRMGPYDSAGDGQRLASLTAKSQLLDQAVTYLQTLSEVKPLALNRDELRAYTAGLLAIREYPSYTVSDQASQTTTVIVQVAVVIDAASLGRQLADLIQRERAKTELMQIRDKIDDYQQQLDKIRDQLRMIKDKPDARPLLQRRSDVLTFIDTEEQLARTWTSLAGTRGLKENADRAQRDLERPKSGGSPRPDNAEEHRKRGVLLTQEKNYDAALAEFRLALKIMPGLDRAHLGLGAALQGQGHIEEAIAEYRLFLDRHPNDPDGQNNLGSALQQKGDLAGAITAYRAALEAQPDDALAHYNFATALSANGQTDEALKEYRTAVRLNPKLIQAYFNMGALLRDLDQRRDASDAFREYLKRAPATPANQPWIEQAQAYLEKAREARQERGGR
ncbi:MAG TPA: tetratricopeptide repeat protein [Nitrospira sp.]|nr:tetratricopeptide repeat protein [Nitrospira sp.]